MTTPKRIASLSVDLDNMWSYMKMHGVAGWETHPSYLDIVVPRMLTFFAERNLRATFMVIGQDAALDSNRAALASIAEHQHEIGNHSFHHDTWLHDHPEQAIRAEIDLAHEQISRATGQTPVGFRAPGFSVSPKTLRALSQRGYLYDASVFPNMLGPVAQLFFNRSSKLSDDEKHRRRGVFGTFASARRPIKPFFWKVAQGSPADRMLEIPVTSMPVFRFPIHMTYIHYLGRYSPFLAMSYFRVALLACRLLGYQPSILLHPPDFLGSDDGLQLSFFPGMDVPRQRKLKILGQMVDELQKHYTVVTLRDFAGVILRDLRPDTPTVPLELEPVDDRPPTDGFHAGRESY